MTEVDAIAHMRQEHDSHVIQPIPGNSAKSNVGPSIKERKAVYDRSVTDPSAFWADVAKTNFHWETLWPEDKPVFEFNYDKSKGNVGIKWFEGATTNMCYNALDRHLPTHKDRVCFYWEGNEPTDTSVTTYGQMYDEVVKLASVLQNQFGVKKGDVVSLYLPMIPYAAVAMLAITRIGAIMSVVFAGFSSQALAARIIDSKSKVVITVDSTFRGPKPLGLKKIVDEALKECEANGVNTKCIVYERHSRSGINMVPGRDVWHADAVEALEPAHAKECPIVWVGAEDPLFILYTSGSTGKPKAILHTTGGYMVYASTTFKNSFDYHLEDVYMCTADIGWVTGHSYVVFGPMVNAATSVLFEGVPTYPSPARWWELVDRYKVSIFYTAPTAIRSLMTTGEGPVKSTKRDTLRVLASVGEPINVEAWNWYYNVVGEGRADVVDTWWQTETGGHMITPMPGCTPHKPGSASLPSFGIIPAILDPSTLKEIEGPGEGLLVIKHAWPGQARTIFGDHERFEQVYFPVDGYYMTGDGARRDDDGYYWITGRVDDVLNVSGHRIGTSEIEDAINTNPNVVESAVVGVPHDVKGEGIYCYVIFKPDIEITKEVLASVIATTRNVIGPLATPDHIHPAQDGLPKTRSGKIMRRVLRKIAAGIYTDLGDLSTLADPSVVEKLIESQKKWVKKA